MPSTPADQVDRGAILEALDVELERPKLSLPYRAGVLGVAFVMLLLPLIYLAIIGLTIWGVCWHATANITVFEGSGSKRLAFLVYMGPLVTGVVLVFFMVKPLFAPRRQRRNVVEVGRDEQPFLYQFVERLCAAVGAPPPRRILVDCRPNASAGFHQGGMGLAQSGRELTIGLPLVGSLPLRHLAGILAHEFGHFSQGTGMRLSFVVAAVNAWFARVVFERDAWDERLAEWTKSNVWYFTVVSALARGVVWLTRKILFGLMWIGHAVSSFMSRQMEFDADQYEIGLAGSDAFARSMRELPLLGISMEAAERVLGEKWQEQRLPDDLPRLIEARRQQLPEELIAQVHRRTDEQPHKLFATHPRDIDRIRAAEAARSERLFLIEAPATVLLDDFESVCRAASVSYYGDVLGKRFDAKHHLVPTSALLEEHERETVDREALRRYFRGSANVMRPLAMPAVPLEPPEDPKQTGLEIKGIRQRTVTEDGTFRTALTDLVQGYDSLADAEVAAGFVSGELKIDHASFGMQSATLSAARRLRAEAEAKIAAAAPRMEPFEKLCSDRLEHALRMLCVPAVGQRVEDVDDLRAEIERLLPAATTIGSVMPALVRVRVLLNTIGRLHEPLNENEKLEKLRRCIADHGRELQDLADKVRADLGELLYPFEHSSGAITVAKWALDTVPSARRLGRLYEVASAANDKLIDLYLRIMARVVNAAERAEKALGFKPLPLPKAKEPAEAASS